MDRREGEKFRVLENLRMYEASFRLNDRPFLSAPRVDRYYPAATIESCRQQLARCVERAEGVGLLVGPSGTGKSLLLTLLAEQFAKTMSVALLSNGQFNSRRALLQAILFQLNLPYRGLDEGELRLALVDHLAEAKGAGRGLLLLLDEAHSLPVRLLEEVRMITNLAHRGVPQVRLILAGNAAIEERLAAPTLASLSQRITARAYLQALDAQETEAYISAQLAAVGGLGSAVFGTHAMRAVYHATGGVPRLINQLCEHALLMAFAGGRSTIDSDGIQEAWADLQQLPTPWNETTPREEIAIARKDDVVRKDSVIEFGTLPDDDFDLEPTLPGPGLATVPLSAVIPHEFELDDEDDFVPAVVTRPEAELLFGAVNNPLAEAFAEEEVVFDKYASADALLGARQRVKSADSSLLSALLDPFTKPAAVAPVTAPATTEVKHLAVSSLQPTDQPARETRKVAAEGRGDEQVRRALSKTFEDQAMAVEAVAAALASEMLPDFARFSSEPSEPAEPIFKPKFASDDEVIIIEDDPRAGRVENASVRRQEYAQLFARLRHG
ncbi:MAG: AAA family ATPase [Planctomycetes bacterium]|nr:AAA family ATPase [Planctomycetota bacterium]